MKRVTSCRLRFAVAALVGLGMMLSAGCATMANVGATLGETAGVITPQQGQSIRNVGEAAAKTFADITPEQEYYIGRAVGATIVSRYKVYDSDAANRYLNVLGQSIALASTKPETFGGYHFLILDTDEINAFAAPGGLIFISRGMIRLCKGEDELAAVLAHEVGHVERMHALKAIKSSRLTSALTTLAMEGAKNFGGEQLAQLTQAFEGSISDITGTMMSSGYARGQEREADESAIRILKQMGYNPHGLVRMLAAMETGLKPGGLDFAKTHPPPASRIAEIRKMIADIPDAAAPAARQKRFNRALGGI